MPKPETQCSRTCRTVHPYEPERWCGGCTMAEAIDREANYLRWKACDTRREVLEVVKARLDREARP